MKFKQVTLALIASLGVVGSAQAALVYGQSDTTNLLLGSAYNLSGTAAGGVQGQLLNLKASFEDHLVSFINNPNYGGTYDPATGIYGLAAGIDLASIPFPHTGLGVWKFKNVSPAASNDVWFGEWAKEVKDGAGNYTGAADAATRTVFYIGNNTGASVPNAGTATYSVSGINNGNNLTATGANTFTANFNNATLTGQLTGTGTVTSLQVNADIDASSASFYGTATANGSIAGDASGHFFGNQATNTGSLAGIAQFNNRNLDTAFGGAQTSYTP